MFIIFGSISILALLFVIALGRAASEEDNRHMTSWENCDGNCGNCKDKGQCMNRPYE